MKFAFSISCVLIALVAPACGGTTVDSSDAGTDGGSKADAATDAVTVGDSTLPPLDAGSFCTGTSPRMMLNGSEIPVINATGKAVVLNCCDSAELIVATGAFQALMNVLWRMSPPAPGTVDLGNAPSGFTIELDLGCDPTITSCATANPEERYTDGFSGTMQYAWSGAGMTTSYCLSVAESPSAPHSVIHSLTLYAPNVLAP
jgi:hypothetical protein